MSSNPLQNLQLLLSKVSSANSNRAVIGIDIDFSSVRIVQKQQSGVLHAFVEQIQIPKDGQREIAIKEALKKAFEKIDISNSDIVYCLCDQKLIVDHITLPVMPAEEVAQAVKLQVGNSQQYPVDKPIIDFLPLDRRLEKGIEKLNVMVAVVAKASVDAVISRFKKPVLANQPNIKKMLFLEDLGDGNLASVIPSSIAIESIIKGSKTSQTIAVFYMGGVISELSIYRDSKLESSRKINVLNADFTKALSSAIFSDSGKIELTALEAQSLRKEFGIPLPSDQFLIRGKITATQAVSLLRPRVEQLCKEIQRCFDIYNDRNQGKKIEKILLLGEAAILKRLDEVLSAELGIPVLTGNPLEGLTGNIEGIDLKNNESIQGLTLALGSALTNPSQGINLLPSELRNIQQKFIQRFSIALAAVFVFIFSIVIFLVLILQINVSKNELDKARKTYMTLLPQANLLKDQLMIDILSSGRMNFGDLLMQLSYAPEEIFFTELKTEGSTLYLSGQVKGSTKDAKATLERMIQDVLKDAVHDVKFPPLKRVAAKKDLLEFKITAQLNQYQGPK